MQANDQFQLEWIVSTQARNCRLDQEFFALQCQHFSYWKVSLSWDLPCPIRNNLVSGAGDQFKCIIYMVSKIIETDKLRIKSRKRKCIFLWSHCEEGQWDTITSSVLCKFPKVRLKYGKKGPQVRTCMQVQSRCGLVQDWPTIVSFRGKSLSDLKWLCYGFSAVFFLQHEILGVKIQFLGSMVLVVWEQMCL